MECVNNSEREANMNIVEQLENNVVKLNIFLHTNPARDRSRAKEKCEFIYRVSNWTSVA